MPSKMNLSFAGCGFLGIYHVGVAVCFKQYAPHLLLNKISGASAGAIAACCLLCDLPLGQITSDLLRVVSEARAKTLGPFSPSFNVQEILIRGLERYLPEDAHERVNGKLHISLTRVYDGKNVIVSHFNSKEDLLQALLASAFVPIFSGFLPPKFHGIRYMDGGFSDNLPTLDENTITVSPFSGESDICPRDLSLQLFHINVANTSIELSSQNIYRFTRILFPPKPEVLSNMCKQGFDDALRFLNRNNLINCNRCLAVQTTFMVQEQVDGGCEYEYDPQCQECKVHRIEAMSANLPETVVSIFQEAIDSANKGLVNWIFKHRSMKLLSVLTLPYTLPADLMYATFNKLVAAAPAMGNNLYAMSKFIMGEVARLMKQLRRQGRDYCGSSSAQITCQLAITQYRANCEDEKEPESPTLFRNRLNFNFTLNLDNTTETATAPREKVDERNPQLQPPPVTVTPTDTPVLDDDAFEHILQVTAQHDAIMAYYYTDDDDNVKVTKIYDIPGENSEGSAKSGQFDEWSESMADSWVPTRQSGHDDDMDGYEGDSSVLASSAESSNEEDVGPEACANVFSDPESEWTRNAQITEPQQPMVTLRHNKSRPESDQEARYSQRSSYVES